jgi:uncharacterized protein
MQFDKAEIIRLTQEYGGGWGLQHTNRLLHLTADLGEGMTYDAEALWVAAHLHDWGAYSAWAVKDVDHCLRSGQVADTFLSERGFPEARKGLILECIALHHSPGSDRSLESILLRDADALDFLGVVGVLRNFSINPRDLRRAFEETKRRREKMIGVISLDKSKEIAAARLKQMDELLAQFEAETFGCF